MPSRLLGAGPSADKVTLTVIRGPVNLELLGTTSFQSCCADWLEEGARDGRFRNMDNLPAGTPVISEPKVSPKFDNPANKQ